MNNAPLPLEHKVAIITGATRGIGRAVLERFSQEGATVIGVYARSGEIAGQLQAELTAQGRPGCFIQGSVDDITFVKGLMEWVNRDFGRIDILVNNAGIARDNLALMMTEEEWDAVLHTNLLGTIHCSAEAIPYMRRQGGGTVINIVSVSGNHGREAQINYAASKGAIVGLSKLLARRHAREGIQIHAVAPGMIATEMTDQVPAGKLDNFLWHTNLKRLGTAAEVAEAIMPLAYGTAAYVSGQVLKVDGGFLR